MELFNYQFRRCRVTKDHAGEERNYTKGETVLWPGEIPIPHWLEMIEVLADRAGQPAKGRRPASNKSYLGQY